MQPGGILAFSGDSHQKRFPQHPQFPSLFLFLPLMSRRCFRRQAQQTSLS